MNVTIERIVYPGKRLARGPGKIVLTDEGLPGEIVEVYPVANKANLIEAETVRIIRPSAERLAPRCAHYRSCSPYQPLPYPRQIETKTAQLRELMAGSKIEAAEGVEVVPSPKIWGYRNRLKLEIASAGGKSTLAYHRPGSRETFEPVETCALASDKANELLAAALAAANKRGRPPWSALEARESRLSGRLVLSLFWRDKRDAKAVDVLITDVAPGFPLAGIASFERRRGKLELIEEWGEAILEEKLGAAALRYGAASFFQINLSILPRVLDDMAESAAIGPEDRIVDLYAGVGALGLALAPRAGSLAAVEPDPSNIPFLKTNIAASRAGKAAIHEGTAEEWIRQGIRRGGDVLIVDPPRKGLATEVVSRLAASPAGKILYLSCNPATLVRDLKGLAPAYRVARLRGYDFFPHTPHIEILAVLRPRTASFP